MSYLIVVGVISMLILLHEAGHFIAARWVGIPIAPLDGGKIVMAIMERLFTPLKRLEMPLTAAGWVGLLGLMLYVTALDVSRIAQAMVA